METPERLSAFIQQALLEALEPYRSISLGEINPEITGQILRALRDELNKVEANGSKEKPTFEVSISGTTLSLMPTNETACEVLYLEQESQETAKEMVKFWRQLNKMASGLKL